MGSQPKFHFAGGKNSQIMVADNAFPKSVARELIEECKIYYDHLFTPGPTIGGQNPSVKSSMDMNLSVQSLNNHGVDTTVFAYCEDQIRRGVAVAVAKYINEFRELWNWPGISDTGFRVQRYQQSIGYYRTHVDGCPWDGGDDVGNRVLGIVVYLNDVEVGGDTYFPAHDLSVPAKTSRISVFPTNWTHPHQGETPLSSDKWMISTFMKCHRRDVRAFDRPDPEEAAVSEPEHSANDAE